MRDKVFANEKFFSDFNNRFESVTQNRSVERPFERSADKKTDLDSGNLDHWQRERIWRHDLTLKRCWKILKEILKKRKKAQKMYFRQSGGSWSGFDTPSKARTGKCRKNHENVREAKSKRFGVFFDSHALLSLLLIKEIVYALYIHDDKIFTTLWQQRGSFDVQVVGLIQW